MQQKSFQSKNASQKKQYVCSASISKDGQAPQLTCTAITKEQDEIRPGIETRKMQTRFLSKNRKKEFLCSINASLQGRLESMICKEVDEKQVELYRTKTAHRQSFRNRMVKNSVNLDEVICENADCLVEGSGGQREIVTFQLFDSHNRPVAGTQFSVSVWIHTYQNNVTLSLPGINFQILSGGGTLQSIGEDSSVPCPTHAAKFNVPSNSGQSLPFFYLDTNNADLPLPIVAYILTISTSGKITISGYGTPGNIIPKGAQVMFPTTVTYTAENYELSNDAPKANSSVVTQLQLFDAYGFPVESTIVPVTLNISQAGNRITVTVPSMSLTTGAYAGDDPIPGFFTGAAVVFQGGTFRTIDGFLPKCLRPSSPLDVSFIVPVGNVPTFILSVTNSGEIVIGATGQFNNLIQPGTYTFPQTTATYYHEPHKKLCSNLQVSKLPSDVTQFTSPLAADEAYRDEHYCDAWKGTVATAWTSTQGTDLTQNTMNCWVSIGSVDDSGNLTMGNPIQITDFPPNVQAWSTSIAINRKDPNIIVVSYALLNHIGGGERPIPCRAISTNGGKTWPAPYKNIRFEGSITGTILTVSSFDPSVGGSGDGLLAPGQIIYSMEPLFFQPDPNRVLPGTIIIKQLTGSPGSIGTYRVNISQTSAVVEIQASAQDNGLLTILSPYCQGFGDNNGVFADRYGNFIYLSANKFDDAGNNVNQSVFAMSSDGGKTFKVIYKLPIMPPFFNPNVDFYDYCQLCFGGDGVNPRSYGIWFTATYFPNSQADGLDNMRIVGFIPITGFGTVGPIPTLTPTKLTSLENTGLYPTLGIAASKDGRVWINSMAFSFNVFQPRGVLFKTPGPIDSNYSGLWQTARHEDLVLFTRNGFAPNGYVFDAYPAAGWIDGNQNAVYDDTRNALYVLYAQTSPDFSEDMTLYLLISRNNGQSWSSPLYISSTKKGNRGVQAMVLDQATGDLIMTWYDGRKDPNLKSVHYFLGRLPAYELDNIVNKIPLSDPLYKTGKETGVPPP